MAPKLGMLFAAPRDLGTRRAEPRARWRSIQDQTAPKTNFSVHRLIFVGGFRSFVGNLVLADVGFRQNVFVFVVVIIGKGGNGVILVIIIIVE